MTTDQKRADSRAAREIERPETCQTPLQLAGMALSFHSAGYMITKGVEIVAEHLVTAEVEDFVADLERQLEREPGRRRDRQPERGPWSDRQWLPEPQARPSVGLDC